MSVQSWFDLSGKTALAMGVQHSIESDRAMALAEAEAASTVGARAIASVDTNNTQALQNDSERISTNRWGSPLDIAGAAPYLASLASSCVHESTHTIAGGWMGR